MDYVLIEKDGEARDAVADLMTRKLVGLDFETTGLDPRVDKPLLAGVDEYILMGHLTPLLRPLVESRDTVKVEYNASFEGMIFESVGIRQQRVVDPMLGDMLLYNGRFTLPGYFTLGQALWRYLYLEHDKSLQTSFVGADPATFVPTEEQLQYLARDVRYLPQLSDAVARKVAEQGMMPTWKLENQYSQAVAMMQYHGSLVDVDSYRLELEKVNAEFDELERTVSEALTPYILEVRRKRFQAMKVPEDAWKAERDTEKERLESETSHGLTGQDRRDWINERYRQWKETHKPPTQARMSHAPILVTSPEQIYDALNEMGIKVENTEKETLILAKAGRPLAEQEILTALGELSVAKKIRANEGTELLSRLQDGNRLTTRYHALKARTGRISSTTWRDKGRCDGCCASVLSVDLESTEGQVTCPSCARTSSPKNFGKVWGANNQNLTSRFKRYVHPGPGRKFVIYDYSQIELRVAADLILAENPHATDMLVKAFRDGLDPHCLTGEEVTGTPYAQFHKICCEDGDEKWVRLRRGMKVVNFSTLFGTGAPTMAVKIYVDTKDDTPFGKSHIDAAQKRINAFWRINPTMRVLSERIGDTAIANGFVETVGGRRRYFETSGLKRWEINGLKRQAVSTRIQGTAADIAKEAQVQLYESIATLDPDAWLWAAVHDEICMECEEEYAPEWEQLMAEILDRAFTKYLHHIDSGIKPGKAIHDTWTH